MKETKTITAVEGSKVEGNITSCGIETKPIRTDRNSALSIFETTTYRSYNVCTGQTINEYQLQSLTDFAILGVPILGLFLICVLAFMSELY